MRAEHRAHGAHRQRAAARAARQALRRGGGAGAGHLFADGRALRLCDAQLRQLHRRGALRQRRAVCRALPPRRGTRGRRLDAPALWRRNRGRQAVRPRYHGRQGPRRHLPVLFEGAQRGGLCAQAHRQADRRLQRGERLGVHRPLQRLRRDAQRGLYAGRGLPRHLRGEGHLARALRLPAARCALCRACRGRAGEHGVRLCPRRGRGLRRRARRALRRARGGRVRRRARRVCPRLHPRSGRQRAGKAAALLCGGKRRGRARRL